MIWDPSVSRNNWTVNRFRNALRICWLAHWLTHVDVQPAVSHESYRPHTQFQEWKKKISETEIEAAKSFCMLSGLNIPAYLWCMSMTPNFWVLKA